MSTRKRKVLPQVEAPEFRQSIEEMAEDSRIFVDRSVDIAYYIHFLMEQKGLKQKDLADKMGKSEAEVSKWLGGLHNYTLRSIAKLEAALGSRVINVPKPQYAISYGEPASRNNQTIREERKEKPAYRPALHYRPLSDVLKDKMKMIEEQQPKTEHMIIPIAA